MNFGSSGVGWWMVDGEVDWKVTNVDVADPKKINLKNFNHSMN